MVNYLTGFTVFPYKTDRHPPPIRACRFGLSANYAGKLPMSACRGLAYAAKTLTPEISHEPAAPITY